MEEKELAPGAAEETPENITPAPAPAAVTPAPDKAARIAELRDRLRREREEKYGRAREIGQAGGNTAGHSGSDDNAGGTTFQATGRDIETATRDRDRIKIDNRKPLDNGRGPKERAIGSRPPGGRSSESDSGAASQGSEGTASASVGRIEADGPIPLRIVPDGEFYREEPKPARKPGRPRKEKTLKERANEIPLVKAMRGQKKASLTLTDEEAEEYEDILPAALEDDFSYLDKYLVGRQRLFTPDDDLIDEIWSNMTEKELETLVKLMIKGGKHNPAMATITRGVVDSADIVAGVSILGPRLKTTGRIMRDTHRPAKKRGQK